MKSQLKIVVKVLAVLALGAGPGVALAGDWSAEGGRAMGASPMGNAEPARGAVAPSPGLVHAADATTAAFQEADPGLARFFTGAVGYAVFPSVDKGAVGIGGAYGRGVLYEHGKPVGRASLTQVTIGPQLGGQAYSEIVFFESREALSTFKKGEVAMAAQASAVAASSGASTNARYAEGVAVFTLPRYGLMAEVSVGGQRFGYQPFTKAL
ncbi:MAG TPA: YSC84-related protein [Anaeromyxobacter sp.]|nr:YSC84-related protein [Anaeromyxobacter sp.]